MTESKTDKELIELATSLHSAIYILQCFASHDIMEYDATINELEKRGYNIQEEIRLIINKD